MDIKITEIMYNLCNVLGRCATDGTEVESVVIQGNDYLAKVGAELYWVGNVGREDTVYIELSGPNNGRALVGG
jgi:hypothetical protein